RIIVSNSTNPFFNIAFEQYLFNCPASAEEKVLYLWRNEPSVIIGRFQGAWKECRVQAMDANRVHLVRRASGGGAVYQDLGNSIFSFLGPKHGPKGISDNNSILVDALATAGIQAAPTGRNDIEVGGQKVSGAAFRHSKNRSLHHGTLLLNLDLQALGNYLTPNKLKMQSKGVSSVAARVMNLNTIAPHLTHDMISEELMKSFKKFHNIEECPIEYVDESFVRSNEEVARNIATISDWEWRFGKEPEFSHHVETRFPWGLIDLYIVVKDGIIGEVTFNTDALDVELVTAIQDHLKGCEYSADKIGIAMARARDILGSNEASKTNLSEFSAWLIDNL
ncbi:unnamed protein product, partial [Ectocarpus fasciculatus]